MNPTTFVPRSCVKMLFPRNPRRNNSDANKKNIHVVAPRPRLLSPHPQVSGESGAGKTVSCKLVMAHLADISRREATPGVRRASSIEERVLMVRCRDLSGLGLGLGVGSWFNATLGFASTPMPLCVVQP